jgi:predicted MPP superfamily phosphohydrolase
VPILLHGLDRMRSRVPFVDAGMVRRLHGSCYPIIMGHAPDFMQSVLRDGLQADALMVAGHTHGGQVQVPGFGPLITLSGVPRWLAGGGVFRHGETWLCCSRGIGMERSSAPRIRFWCRPQLLLLELAP